MWVLPASSPGSVTHEEAFMSSAFDFDPQPRRASVAVDVGGVIVGGGAPVVVQSMTNTDTADIDGTVAQVAAA